MSFSESPESASSTPARPLALGRVAAAGALLCLVGAAAGLLPRLRARTELDGQTRQLAVPTVLVTRPAPGRAAAPPAFAAEVRPLLESPIHARAAGYLRRWMFDIGGRVEAGQLLAEIESPEVAQELERARAELAHAGAAQTLAQTTTERWEKLLAAGTASQQEAAEKRADLELKTAQVAAAAANVRRLEELQSFQRVTAPFAGVITARRVDVGELVNPGSGRELFRLAQSGTLRVFVRLPQSLARAVAVGQEAEFLLPETPGRVIPAKVVRTAGAIDPASRTLLTELEVDNARGEILAGSFGQVRFNHARVDAALTLPATTLLYRSAGPQVGVVGANGAVAVRSVTLGRDFGSTLEVLGGVSASDQVIINPPDALADGMQVRVGGAGSGGAN